MEEVVQLLMEYGALLQLFTLVTPLLAVGGAWGGAVTAARNTRKRQDRQEHELEVIESRLEDYRKQSNEQHVAIMERLASVEAKVDYMVAQRKEPGHEDDE